VSGLPGSSGMEVCEEIESRKSIVESRRLRSEERNSVPREGRAMEKKLAFLLWLSITPPGFFVSVHSKGF